MQKTIKHKDEWPYLIDTAKKNGLFQEQIVFLLALRELEDGSEGSEFHMLESKGAGLIAQTESIIRKIKEEYKRYQDYLREREEESKMEFSYFFSMIADELSEWIDLVTQEFTNERNCKWI